MTACLRGIGIVAAVASMAPGPTLDARRQAVPARPLFAGTAYAAAVEAYRASRSGEALERMIELGNVGVRFVWGEGIQMGAGSPSLSHARAAAMLHVDVADAVWAADRGRALEHFEMSRRWADFTETYPETPPGDTFRARWYLAAGLLLVERGASADDVDAALAHFDRACRLLPDDEAILNATAWLEERAAFAAAPWDATAITDPSAAGDAPSASRQREWMFRGVPGNREYLERAAGRLSEAVMRRGSPGVETTLRLARVRALLGESAIAERLLESLAVRSDVPAKDAYLARLFLGQLFETRREAERALDLYRQAVARVPSGQTARLAIARLLAAGGDARGAVDALTGAPPAGGGQGVGDPWADYLEEYLTRGPALRDALRRQARS